MSAYKNKVDYLIGLAEGMNITKNSEEGKFITEILSVLNDMNESIEKQNLRILELEYQNQNLNNIVNDIDDVVYSILESMLSEDFLLPDDLDEPSEDQDVDDLDIYEVECSNCGEHYLADFSDFMENEVICPNCFQPYNLPEETLEKLKAESEHNHE